MDTLLIQLTNKKAYKLLQDMEELQLIKLLEKDNGADGENLNANTASNSFRGALKLTDEQYEDFKKHAKEIRNDTRKLEVIRNMLNVDSEEVLAQLEDVLKKEASRKNQKDLSKPKPSDYVGCISKQTANEMLKEIEQSRAWGS